MADKESDDDIQEESRIKAPDKDDQVEITADDLADPETLLHKLESVQISEEDTEELLHEAYKVNMKLKEILRRREQDSNIQMRKIRTAGGLSGRQLNSSKSPLPPISSDVPHTTRNAYTAHSGSRSPPKLSGRTSTSQSKRSPSRKGSSVEKKPEWDSRFSYT